MAAAWAATLAIGGAAHAAGNADAASSAAAEIAGLANRAIAAENAGDMATVLDCWAAGDHAILDDFPPFSWRGADALTAWLADYAKEMARAGETDPVSRIGPPLSVRAEGGRVYAVFADIYTYKQRGAAIREDLLWTIVAARTAQGLKIESMAFTGGPRK